MVEIRIRRRAFSLITAGLVVGLLSASARAGTFPAAEETVQRLVQQIAELLVEGQGQQVAIDELATVLDEEADLTLLGRLALGRHWRSATPEQQAEYEDLFKTMMLRRFAGYLNAYSGEGPAGFTDDLLVVRGSREVAGGDILVDTIVAPDDAPPIDVMWRLRDRNGAPVVIDLIIEEISLLITQRAEFSAVIEREGVDGLLSHLRDQDQTES